MITYSKLGKHGRLGNSMWQVASVIGLAIKHGHNFFFPEWKYSQYFDNLRRYCVSEPNDYKGMLTLSEPSPYYHNFEHVIEPGKKYDLLGYFQSYKYFEHCKDLIRYYFTPNFETNELFGEVAIHVRRGDYLGIQHIHPLPGMEYYNKAMEHFPNSKFAVFSDDVDWCIENFPEDKCTFVVPTHDISDLFYMSKHKHQIIANSSFSWWAAYLNTNKHKRIIAPKVWVAIENKNDRVPEEWIRM